MKSEGQLCCTLDAEEGERRRVELERGLMAMVLEHRELADGVALRLPATEDARAAVEAFIVFERECCSFLTFVTRDGGRGDLWLELTGPDGTVDFLHSQLARAGSQ